MARTFPWWIPYTFDSLVRGHVQLPERVIAPYIRLGAVVLEPGCGMGLFTVPLARRVGSCGRVVAIDKDALSLKIARRRLERLGLASRVRFVSADVAAPGVSADQPGAEALRDDPPADFGLAMWMAHEVGDLAAFVADLRARLRPGAQLLLAEPVGHVNAARFRELVTGFESGGFQRVGHPRVHLSRSALFRVN